MDSAKSFWDLGGCAPTYIVIVLAVTMLGAVITSYKQYDDFHVNMHEAKVLEFIPLSYFLLTYFSLSTLLLLFTILNLFSGIFSEYVVIHAVIKILLFLCGIFSCYISFEFVKKHREVLAVTADT